MLHEIQIETSIKGFTNFTFLHIISIIELQNIDVE
jgi:hypothetical protein